MPIDERLHWLVMEFHSAQLRKLYDNSHKVGWDDSKLKDFFKEAIDSALADSDYVSVANYAMFLWKLDKELGC